MNFFDQIDTIDSLIAQSQYSDAIEELKKLEKAVYEPWSCIGVYKRYSLLGENKLAEKTLKNGLKRNPKNAEITAVYASVLNRQERFAEAEKIGKDLQGTQYASIYAETIFKRHKSKLSATDSKVLYGEEQYYNLYYDSYQASKNPVWLRNCASFFLCRGLYEQASKLTPVAFNDSDDAYFWAMVNYDAGNYFAAINSVETGFEFLDSLSKKTTSIASEMKLTALASDSYIAISDMEAAHDARARIIAEYVAAGADIKRLSGEDKDLLPLLVVNSAISANEAGNDKSAADLLSYTVNNFPYYVPGLICYADFAYNSSLVRREDDEMVALRNAGLRSREMERYDNRAQIPLSDAVSKIDHALATVNDPYLYITKLDLRYKMNPSLTSRDKTADLWKLLEQSSSEAIRYYDVIIWYAENFFLETNQVDDAEQIFKKYIRSKFGLKNDGDFYEDFMKIFRTANMEDIELAAWFAISHKKVSEAVGMYEYCVYESAGIKENDISQKVSTQSAVNLANIYSALGRKSQALELYGKIAARETDPTIRSDIFYRIATIHYFTGDTKNALKAVDYAYSINPQNAKAHLLKVRLKDDM